MSGDARITGQIRIYAPNETLIPSISYTQRGLRLALAALGATADEVAAALPAVGPVGCPLTAHLFAVFPKAVDVTVNADDHGTLARLYLDGDVVDTVLPPPVAAFIAAFDDGGYQQLRAEDRSAAAIGRAPCTTVMPPPPAVDGPMEALADELADGFGVAAMPDALEPPRIFHQLVADLDGASPTGPDATFLAGTR